MKFNFSSSAIKTVDNKSTSKEPRKPSESKTTVSKFKIVRGGFNAEFDMYEYVAINNDIKYPVLFLDEYYPDIILATEFNNNYDTDKPAVIMKPKTISQLTRFWTHFYDGMELSKCQILDVEINNVLTKVCVIDTNELKKVLRDYRDKWFSKNSKR